MRKVYRYVSNVSIMRKRFYMFPLPSFKLFSFKDQIDKTKLILIHVIIDYLKNLNVSPWMQFDLLDFYLTKKMGNVI